MEYKTSIDIFKRYFEQKFTKSFKTLEKSDLPGNPFVTVSRSTGAGGVNFPEKLVHHLNEQESKSENKWMIFDKDVLEMVLEEHNLPKEIKKFMPEKKVSEFQDVIEQLFGLHPNEHKLIKKVSDTILHLSHIGNVVFVGRGSNIITAECKYGLHLRILDSLENRIENIQNYFKLNKVQALKLIQTEDKNRKNYVKKYFNKDINNPLLYSLVINFEAFKTEDVIQMIAAEVQNLKRLISSETGSK